MGPGGSGKTFLARQLPGELCATTGIAALNLGPGVSTVNSLIGYFDTASLKDMWITGRLTAQLGRLYASGIRRLILDEMSMLPGEQLTVMCEAIDELARGAKAWKMGLTLVGDFCQLGPVKAEYCFEVPAWERFAPHLTVLKDIRRQEDRDFIDALQAVRRGDRVKAMEYFADKVERTLVEEWPGVTVLPVNAEVDRYNALRHAKVKGEELSWQTRRWGKERGEWKQIPDKLQIKVGSLVMMLANRKELDLLGRPTGEYIYVNGDLGEVQGIKGAEAAVKLQRTGEVVGVEMVTREHNIACDSERRKELRDKAPELLRGDRQQLECIGSVTYMPMRLAWATTTFKSQGLTLDHVQLSVAHKFWELPGQLYVALSRARSSKGLRIVGSRELLAKRMVTDPKVLRWT